MNVAAAAGLIAASLLQVTPERLENAASEPGNWLTYSGTYMSQRHSALDQVTTENVGSLRMAWAHQMKSLEKFEATPLVVDGIMYVTQAPNDVIALDAATGRVFWTYEYEPSAEARLCCGLVNRGVAILGDTLFMATIDGNLVALDAFNGRPVWIRPMVDPALGYSLTLAPLAIGDKVIIGTAGGEYGIRGFIAAYDAGTGEEVWRFYTIPGPGEPGHETWEGDSWMHGGASVWLTGSYDPELNLTYWGVGNPGPDYFYEDREGDNLYSDSVVALDADTGELRWHFQFTPGDTLDYDAVQIPVLVDAEWRGTSRRLMLWANRNGFFYVLDRTDGTFLHGSPFGTVTWAQGLDANGRPVRSGLDPTREGEIIYPGALGVTNWYSPSYSPGTGLFYVPTWVDYYALFTNYPVVYEPGQRYTGGTYTSPVTGVRGVTSINTRPEEEGHGAVRALDTGTGEIVWEFRMTDVTESGVLTTATDLLFTGSRDGSFYALDARTGDVVWQASLGGQIVAGPVAYSVGGRQFIAIAAGSTLFTFALAD